MGYDTWEPEEQYQWIQLKRKVENMDLKRAISRVETIARRPSWEDTEQARAIAVVIEAAKKQLPPEPRDHLHLYKDKCGWQINYDGSGQLQTKQVAEKWDYRGGNRRNPSVVVKVPV